MLHDVFRNELLRRLDKEDAALLKPQMERVHLKLRTILHEARAPIEFVYFPENCIASLVARLPGGKDSEVGMVGFEGMTGTELVLGGDRPRAECVVQLEGYAVRIPAQVLDRAMAESSLLRPFLARYVQSLSTQTAFTALVNARLTMEERLARWLLMCADRVNGDSLTLTHDYLAVMLGARRPGVTVAIQTLEGKGFIRATRGKIEIRDRNGLIGQAHGGYGAPEAEYERLISAIELRDPAGQGNDQATARTFLAN